MLGGKDKIIILVVIATVLVWPQFGQAAPVSSTTWKQTAGPLGGTVTKLYTVDNEIFAALYSGGIYQRVENSWQQIGIGHGLPENRSFDLVVDPTNPAVMYSTMMIACGAKSVDAGQNWTGFCDTMLSQLGVDNISSDTIVLDLDDPNIVYMAARTHAGARIFIRSPDAGNTWEVVSTFENSELFFNHLVFFNNKMYLVTRNNGVYTSTDKGVTWTEFNTGLNETQGIRFAVDTTNNSLYLATGLFQYNVRSGGALYRLSSDETSWLAIAGPTQVTGVGVEQGRVWAGTETGEVWRQNDSGTMQQLNMNQLAPGAVSEFAFTTDGIFIGVGGYGIYHSSNNGVSFVANNSGLKSIATRETHVHPTKAKELLVVTWDRLGLYYSRNGGKSYKTLQPGRYFLTIGIDPANFYHLYGGANQFFEMQLSRKGKLTMQERVAPGPEGSVIKAVAVDPVNPRHVLAGVAAETAETPAGYGLYYSTDSAKHWQKATGIPDQAVYSIIFDPKKPTLVYASALGAGVYKSSDGGKSFSQIGGEALKYTYRLSLSARQPQVLIAGSNAFFAQLSTADQISGEYGGVFRTMDGGKNWTELTAGIRDYDGTGDPAGFQTWLYNFGHLPNYEQILINPKNPDNIIVGHHGESVVVTTDGGSTWQKPTTGMIPGSMHNYAYCLATSKSFRTIYACSCGRGLFSGKFSAVTQNIVWNKDITSVIESTSSNGSVPTNATEARLRVLGESNDHDHYSSYEIK